MSNHLLKLASRSSPLALWQAGHVRESLLAAHPGLDVEIVHVTTTGDANTVDPLRSFGGLGVFTKEVQSAVLDGRADLAVHSLKDLPTDPTPGLDLACVTPRGLVYDLLILKEQPGHTPARPWDALPREAIVGTGSIRRSAQLLHQRPDLVIKDLRGNIATRLAKLAAGEYDAILMAAAAIDRLDLKDLHIVRLEYPDFFAAVSQGALGLEVRSDDLHTRHLLSPLTHQPTMLAVTAERALLNHLRAGCHAPVGVVTTWSSSVLTMHATVLTPNGTRRLDADQSSTVVTLFDAQLLGKSTAQRLLEQGATEFLQA